MTEVQKGTEDVIVNIGVPVTISNAHHTEHLFLIKNRRGVVRKAMDALEEAKLEAKSAKDDYDLAVKRLLSAVDEEDPEPLFNQTTFDKPGETAEPVEDNAWRAVVLDEVVLPDGIRQKLEDAGITTIGDIADAGGRDGGFESVEGIGAGKAAIVADAMDTYWKDHPRDLGAGKPDLWGDDPIQLLVFAIHGEPSQENDDIDNSACIAASIINAIVSKGLLQVRDLVAWCDRYTFEDIDGIDDAMSAMIHTAVEKYGVENPNPSGVVESDIVDKFEAADKS